MHKYLTASKLFFSYAFLSFCNKGNNFYPFVDGSNFPADLTHHFPVMTQYCGFGFPFKVTEYKTYL